MYLQILGYTSLIILYLWTRLPLFKAFPCLMLYILNNNPCFIFAAFGDFFLDIDWFIPGLFSFGVANLFLKRFRNIEDISPEWWAIAFLVQPVLIYTFQEMFILVDFYVFTLINLLTSRTLAAYLFVLSDLFVLAQYMGFQVSYISLPLYWLSMWFFNTEENIIKNK